MRVGLFAPVRGWLTWISQRARPTVPDPTAAMPVALARHDLIACEHCARVHRRVVLGGNELARCSRCGALLARGHRLSLQGLVALSLAALLALLVAHGQPLVSLGLQGMHAELTLPEAFVRTWQEGEHLVAVLAWATAALFPLTLILLRLYVQASLLAGFVPAHFAAAMRALRLVSRWSMVEVLLLGALVAVVRISGMASVVPGPGLFALGLLVILLAAVEAAGLHRLWRRADALQHLGERTA